MTAISNDSQQALLRRYQSAVAADIERGLYEPFVWPYRALGPNLVILYLLIPPTGSRVVFLARYPLFLFVVWHAIDSLLWCKSSYVTIGYGIGLLNAWTVVWAATLLLFNDARADFRRIEAGDGLEDRGVRLGKDSGDALGESRQSRAETVVNQQGLKRRNNHDRDETEELGSTSATAANGTLKSASDHDRAMPITSGANSTNHQLHWSALPNTLLHRFDWVADLVTSFRGPRWAHRIPPLPPPPLSVQRSLRAHSPAPTTFKAPTPESNLTAQTLLRNSLPELIILIISLDILKYITSQDPYYLGIPLPQYFFPFPTRLLISAIFTYTALSAIFVLSPLAFACLLGERHIGSHAWAWQYPPCFGSPRAITQRGLEGVWGIWWQQLFRFGFQEWGDGIARLLDGGSLSRRHDLWGNQLHGEGKDEVMVRHESGWGRKTEKGKNLRACVAFAISAVLHACASYSALGPGTRPLIGSAAFFLLQPFGFLLQNLLKKSLRRQNWASKCPWWVVEGAYLAFVVTWFTLTGPFIADDFARTGVWLFEPLPFSVLKGVTGKGWWRWGGRWVSWHSDRNHWWKSGIAF